MGTRIEAVLVRAALALIGICSAVGQPLSLVMVRELQVRALV